MHSEFWKAFLFLKSSFPAAASHGREAPGTPCRMLPVRAMKDHHPSCTCRFVMSKNAVTFPDGGRLSRAASPKACEKLLHAACRSIIACTGLPCLVRTLTDLPAGLPQVYTQTEPPVCRFSSTHDHSRCHVRWTGRAAAVAIRPRLPYNGRVWHAVSSVSPSAIVSGTRPWSLSWSTPWYSC